MKTLHLTEERYQALLKRGRFGAPNEITGLSAARNSNLKPSKYHAIKTTVAGEKFDSKLEARVYQALKLREVACEIRNLRRLVKFALFCPGGEWWGAYTADFVFDEHIPGMGAWQRVVADAKSPHTRQLPAWKRVRKMMMACHAIDVMELP